MAKDRTALFDRLGKKWVKLNAQEKKVKESKDKIRGQLTGAIRDSYAETEHLLPTLTETIPNTFFEDTGLSHDRFLGSRYPSWNLIKTVPGRNETTFILRKRPEYMGKVIELEDQKLSKIAVEYTPEIDWETLDKEFPDLAQKLSKEVTTRVLDEMALEQEAKDNPELFAILRRHMISKTPTNKYLIGRKEDGN